jgi:ATP-dependent DNA helicase PIF1
MSKIEIDELGLSKRQREAYNIMMKGYNIFVTGSAGHGKTFLIKKFCSDKSYKNIAITSTTGSSAILIGGVTLHSYLGIGLGKLDVDKLYIAINNKKFYIKRWRTLDILIIDEISMLGIELFNKIEKLARLIRRNELPFGGIQLILSGDYCQLPSVDDPKKFCFESDVWKKCIQYTVYLNENFRQSDPILQSCLDKIRLGILDEECINILKSRVDVKLSNDIGIQPTKMYCLNRDVERENEIELNKLFNKNKDLEFFEYELEYEVTKKNINPQIIEDKIKKNSNFPYKLKLCVGAQVMLLINLDFEKELVNGSRGVITSFKDDLPVVKFLNNYETVIDYKVQEIEECNEVIAIITQIPLKVAFSLSIHKAQGVSLDYAEIDLKDVFESGQAYVALSRVKTLEGLSLKNFNKSYIFANKTAIKYYENLEKV